MGRFRRRQHRDGGADRGATAVEYALITAVVLFASVGAIKALERNADDYYDTTSTRIGALPGTEGEAPTGTSLPGGGPSTSSVSTTTTTTAPTTTTAAPTTTTTAAPTTTTTRPPTTTTAAPTTTTTATPESTIADAVDTSDTSGRRAWRPAATVTIRNTSTNAPVAGASVTVVFRRTSGSYLGSDSCTTGSTGRCEAQISGVSDNITSVVATVTSVTASPPWDGGTTTISIRHP